MPTAHPARRLASPSLRKLATKLPPQATESLWLWPHRPRAKRPVSPLRSQKALQQLRLPSDPEERPGEWTQAACEVPLLFSALRWLCPREFALPLRGLRIQDSRDRGSIKSDKGRLLCPSRTIFRESALRPRFCLLYRDATKAQRRAWLPVLLFRHSPVDSTLQPDRHGPKRSLDQLSWP